MKVISGVVVPKKSKYWENGWVKIDLSTGRATETSKGRFSERAVQGSGVFKRRPCTMIALRRVGFKDSDAESVWGVGTVHNSLDLEDHFVKKNGKYTHFYIEWKASPNCSIRKISVMIIGEAE